MFTWICPQCGREVPPSASECPACAEARAAAARPPVVAPPPVAAPPPPQYQAQPQPQYQQQQPQQQPYFPPPPPPPQYPPQQQYQPPPPPQYQQQPQYQVPQQPSYVIAEPKRGLPSWLVGILVTVVVGGGLFGVYKVLGTDKPATKASESAPQKAGPADGGAYGKYLEVTAFRLLESADKKPRVRFTVVNHAASPMGALQLQVALSAAGSEGQPPFAIVDANVGDIEAFGTKEIDLPIKTKLRVYELPDWQFIKTSFTVTSPK